MNPEPVRHGFIYAITDRRRVSGDDGEACERTAAGCGLLARAGVDAIQIRERGLDDRRLAALVRSARDAVAGSARLLVNDRTDVALATAADGVHLPASAADANRVRRIVPATFLIGRSVHRTQDAIAAEDRGGCDYLMFGTVFRSDSKPDDHVPAGLAALADVCSRVRLPIIAVGGMTLERAADVARAGASGIAAISLFADLARAAMDGGNESAALARLRALIASLRSAFDSGQSVV